MTSFHYIDKSSSKVRSFIYIVTFEIINRGYNPRVLHGDVLLYTPNIECIDIIPKISPQVNGGEFVYVSKY